METNQPAFPPPHPPTLPPVYAPPSAAPGMFGTKIPSTVAFVIAVLLFLMPFVDIKCNGTSLKTFSGVELATGYNINADSKGGGLFDNMQEKAVDVTSKATDKKKRNLYILIGLIAGGAGLLLSFTNSKVLLGVALFAGVAGAGSLVAGMLDIKKEAKMEMPNVKDKVPDNDVGDTIDKVGEKVNDLADNVKITVDFTPWFYIAIIAFLAAAFFCYKRMSASKTG